MNDMRRTLLWVIFTMSLVMLWDGWNRHNGHASMFSPAPAAAVAKAASAAASASTSATALAAATPASGLAPADGAASAAAPALPREEVRIKTDLVNATFDTRGGDLVGLELLQHRDSTDRSQNVKLFTRGGERFYAAQTGLIPAQGAPALPNHLTVMKLASASRELAAGQDSLAVRFESPEVNGVQLVKTYTFKRGVYTVDVTHELVNRSAAAVAPQLYLQLVRDSHVESTGNSMAPSAFTGPAFYNETSHFKKIAFGDLDKKKVDPIADADNGWVAMVQHYFTSAWIPQGNISRKFQTERLEADVNGVPTYRAALLMTLGPVAPGSSVKNSATLYAGPQEENKLAAIAPNLELVKDYGIFKVISEPLFWLLDHLHTLIGNWGWAIMALVVLLKIAFYWLNASAYRSMAKMKAINPRVQELRERYKDKPQQMQQEMMRIYKEEKVNPLGGCLPIFVQMPVFIALYWVLLSTVEMRDAPWIGWIHDLSTKDPYFILPLLMTGSSLLQVWFQPAPADPVQAKMMWVMPLAFSAMFFVFPSGLTLYYLTNNLLSIAQQWFITRQIEGSVKK